MMIYHMQRVSKLVTVVYTHCICALQISCCVTLRPVYVAIASVKIALLLTCAA